MRRARSASTASWATLPLMGASSRWAFTTTRTADRQLARRPRRRRAGLIGLLAQFGHGFMEPA
jgi:hypothetical protein